MKRFFIPIVVFIVLSLTLSNVFAEERAEPAIVAEKGGVLIGKGRLVFEPGFQYTHISTQRLDILQASQYCQPWLSA